MKTRKGLLAVAVAASTVAAFACSSGKKSGGSGSPTPTPGPKVDYTLTGSGFNGSGGPYNGDVVGFRVLQGTTVVYCTTAGVIGGGSVTLTATSALSVGTAYHGEAYVSKDGNATYDSSADISYYDPAVGTTAGTTFIATSNGRAWAISKTPNQPITWPSGTTCQ